MKAALDWRSAGLVCTADPRWRSKIWQGGWLLMLPFIGWPMALGYRRLFVERLLDGERPLLPEWRGHRWIALRHGLGAMAVIHVWYAPVYLWLGLRTADWMPWEALPWLPVLVVAATFAIFSTLLVPAWLLWLRFGTDVEVPQAELLLIGATFAAVTFFIPAGFLNVASTRRIVTAFDVPSSLRRIRAAPRAYVEAWLGSGILSLLAHFCLPLAPWAVLWCYLAIIYSFSELPEIADADAQPRSWYRYMRTQHWQHYCVRRVGLVERYEFHSVEVPRTGPPAPAFRALCVGPLRLLLPGAIRARER